MKSFALLETLNILLTISLTTSAPACLFEIGKSSNVQYVISLFLYALRLRHFQSP